MRRAWLIASAVSAGLLPACAPTEARDRGPDATPAAAALLISPAGWRPVASDADPFDDRPDAVECPADSHGFERVGGSVGYEVDTGGCHYFSAGQPALGALEAGDVVELRLWHYALTAPEPASAHVGLAIGGRIVWEASIAIPAAASAYDPRIEIPEDVPVGTPIVFHLHNHGANHWALIDLFAVTEP